MKAAALGRRPAWNDRCTCGALAVKHANTDRDHLVGRCRHCDCAAFQFPTPAEETP